MKKRLFAVLASLCMVVSMVPAMAFAQDSGAAIGANGLCEHHTEHTADCGYTEGTAEIPCGHEHTEDRYTLAAKCVHTHMADCYPVDDAATPSDAEEKEPVCGHVCSEESGCITKTLACNHTHDEACGYVPAIEGTPCTFVCEVCNAQDSGNPATPSDAQPEECTCETLCTGDNINEDCPVCGAEDAEPTACKGLEAQPATLSNALPATALAAAPESQVIYVGNESVTNGGYWTTDSEGKVTSAGATQPSDNYIHYDAADNTLTLHNATIREYVPSDTSTYVMGAGIGVFNQNDASKLTIKLEGSNAIENVSTGIFVLAFSESTGSSSLTITGSGSLDASGRLNGIMVQSNSGDATLTIQSADVTLTSNSGNGVTVQAGSAGTQGHTATLTVNGGKLTASGAEGIEFNASNPSYNITTELTVSGNALVDTRNGGIEVYGTGAVSTTADDDATNGGIVFDGSTGTVYGNVELQKDLEIKSGETLTIPDGSSLNCNNNLTNNGTILVESGGTLEGTVTPPIISKHPENKSVTAGSPAVFSVTASAGGQLTYQWQQKTTDSESKWKDISNATTASYTTEATTTSMNDYQYRCVVTANGVSVISAPATLTVNEPTTYTITVHASAGGTATADKTAAAEGETVNLTATPASGYHFDGWSVVSGTVTIQNNQFIMPAGNVEIQAVFDRNSSSRGSDSSYTQRQEEFWDGVKEQIRDADPGDTIKVNARSYDRLPYSVMKLLGEQDDVTLRISWNDGDPIEIPSAFAENEPQRVYYPLEELAEMDFTQPAEPEADKPETETSVGTDATTGTTGDTSGSWTGGTVTQPAESRPEAEEPDSEPESEPETEPESEPTISEPDEETMTEPERGELPMSWVLGGAVIVIAVGAGGFWFWKRRSQE